MTEAEEHLMNLLETAVLKHTRKKDRARRASWFLKIAVMLLGMIATIFLGLTFKEGSAYITFSRNAALICTALSAFLAGLASFWNVDHYWIKRKVIVTQLEELLDELEFSRASTAALSNDQIKSFFHSYRDVVRQQTEYWEGVLASTPTAKEPSKAADDDESLK